MEGTRNLFSFLTAGDPQLSLALSVSGASGRLGNVLGTGTLARRKGSQEWEIPLQLQSPQISGWL